MYVAYGRKNICDYICDVRKNMCDYICDVRKNMCELYIWRTNGRIRVSYICGVLTEE